VSEQTYATTSESTLYSTIVSISNSATFSTIISGTTASTEINQSIPAVTIAVPNHPRDVWALLNDRSVLELRVKELEARLDLFTLRQRVSDVHEIRSVPIEEVRDLVADYLERNSTAYPSDIARALRISLRTTMTALKDLEIEGTIKKTEK
jgi:hypothetical protein